MQGCEKFSLGGVQELELVHPGMGYTWVAQSQTDGKVVSEGEML